MGKEISSATTEEIFAAPIAGGAEMRAVINQRVASSRSANPIAGVLLPRYKTTSISTMPNASPHQHIHTGTYYANVNRELFAAQDRTNEKQVRAILKSIATRLQSGQFGY